MMGVGGVGAIEKIHELSAETLAC